MGREGYKYLIIGLIVLCSWLYLLSASPSIFTLLASPSAFVTGVSTLLRYFGKIEERALRKASTISSALFIVAMVIYGLLFSRFK